MVVPPIPSGTMSATKEDPLKKTLPNVTEKGEADTPTTSPVSPPPSVDEGKASTDVSDVESLPSLPSTPSQPSTPTAESSAAAEAAPSVPLPKVGDIVMVELNKGYKMGIVKYVGATEFAPGDWIGVALDDKKGNHDGMVKGKRYFRCKPKCGVFVKNDKIIKRPSLGGGGSTSCATGPRRLSGQPPMSSTSPSRTSCPTSTAGLATGPSTPRKKSLSAGKEPSYLRSTASSARRSVKRNS